MCTPEMADQMDNGQSQVQRHCSASVITEGMQVQGDRRCSTGVITKGLQLT